MSTPFRNACDAAVIGAGAAGIAAARMLQAAGYRTQLIEARSRPGGRAVTETHGGFALDLGCGWLHSADDNPYVGAARELGFTLDTTLPPWQRPMPEAIISGAEQGAFRAALNGFYERLETGAQAAGDRPASDFLEPGDRWNPTLHAVSTYVNGCELDTLSTKDFGNYRDTEINYRVREGYGALIARLAQEAPVVYDCPVRRIDRSGVEICVDTAKGVLRAKVAVVCVPTNILASGGLEFFPALPEKIEAARQLPLGLADKFYMTAEGAQDLPEDSRLFGRTDRAATGGYHLRPYGYPLIEGYYGGECARELEKDGLAGFAAFAIEEICGLFGSRWRNRLKPLAASAWARDPFALGSYSHAMPGHWDKRAALAAPVEDRLFFAGEATAPHYFSTAHGARESGERAAREVMRALEA